MNPITNSSLLRLARPAAFVGALLALAATASATQVLVDFGRDTTQTTVDTLSRQWNNVTQNMAAGANFGLVDTANASTGITFTLTSAFNLGDYNANGVTNSPLYPSSATGDSLFGNVVSFGGEANVVPVLTLSGLDPAKTYDFTFFASRSATDNRIAKYTAAGAGSSSVFLDADGAAPNTVTLTGVTPSAGGTISITISHSTVSESGLPTIGTGDNSTGFAYLGVLDIQYTSAIPEPASAASLAAGAALVAVGALRRRRSK